MASAGDEEHDVFVHQGEHGLDVAGAVASVQSETRVRMDVRRDSLGPARVRCVTHVRGLSCHLSPRPLTLISRNPLPGRSSTASAALHLRALGALHRSPYVLRDVASLYVTSDGPGLASPTAPCRGLG